MMNIGLDFDGVIADCGALKREGALRLFGKDIPVEKFKKEIVIGEGLLTLEQYRFLQAQIYGTRELGFLAVVVPGALEYIDRFKQDGHIVTVVTSRTGNDLDIGKEWASRQGLSVDFVGCEGSKESYCNDLKLDVFVDDDFDKLESVAAVVKDLFLFSWGYNADVAEKPLATRVYSWSELYEKISQLSN